MKKVCSIISCLLAICMIFSALASCSNNSESAQETESPLTTNQPSTENNDTSNPVTNDTTSNVESGDNSSDIENNTDKPVTNVGEDTSADEDSATEDSATESKETAPENSTESEESTKPEQQTGVNALINHANTLANGVQAYFPYPDRTHFAFENQEMILDYALSSNDLQQVTSLKNKNGLSYIENTMDVFVTMENGKTYYASKSSVYTTANIYRFGYYFYEMRLEEQVFADELVEKSSYKIAYKNVHFTNHIDICEMDGAVLCVENSASATDPQIIFGTQYLGLNQSTSKYNYLKISLKADKNVEVQGSVYAIAGEFSKFNANQHSPFSIVNDGEVHDYYIPLYTMNDYTGNIRGLRLDINGKGAKYEIHGLSLVKIDTDGAPFELAMNRSFNVYSDKMHHTIQIAAKKETTGITNIGMKTEIDASTVSAVVVEDKNGIRYTFDGADWASAKYVAFNITGVGIFGYILPYDGSGGTIEVTLENGIYTIIQSKTPQDGKIIPSRGKYNEEKGYYESVVAYNANDFYMSQRIYTDANSDFTEFLYEAYCEINPLSTRNISVSSSAISADYLGYDTARGIYIFKVEGPSGGFNTAYYTSPNKHYNVTFKFKGDNVSRKVYMMTQTSCGALECAVILNEDKLLLPIPIEVGKNFSEAAGERNLFNINDETYGEAIFPMIIGADERGEYTVINLYQRWGNYPLKQISWIQFNAPYYHLSTGVTETNCILPWYSTKYSKGLNTLPDFRTMSASFWENQPQHESCGVHKWLIYTDAEGNYVTSENTVDIIDSYGPVYADVKMEYLSDDGKIKVTYVHSEMPQIDENRTYYEIKYEILEDVTINDFRNNFQFYSVGPRNEGGYYKKIGYLDSNNKISYADAIYQSEDDSLKAQTFILGNDFPYFSFFDMDGVDPKNPGYANVAALIYNSSFVIGGVESTPRFIINNVGKDIALSLDLGNTTLKAGDEFTINMILLPWGSEELDPDHTDPNDPNAVNYYTVINEAKKEQYLDKNVRDVRVNSLLNPIKATANKDCVALESVFIPKVKTTNGESAEFTISGGNDNVAVRVYGFNKLTAPQVEVYENDSWTEYRLNSSKNPDTPGYIHYYDGYSVYYDEDGTYSYSFIVTMNNGAPRKFRVKASEDFKGWPSEPTINEKRPDYLDVYVDYQEIHDILSAPDQWAVSDAIVSPDMTYVSLYGTGPDALNNKGTPVTEGYLGGYSVDTVIPESGHILVLKYRIPTTNSKAIAKFEFFTSTVSAGASASNVIVYNSPIADGNWHVLAIDLSAVESTSFKTEFVADDSGKYYAKFLRFDFFSSCMEKTDYVDIAFFGIDNSMEDICNYLFEESTAKVDTIDLVRGNTAFKVDVASGKEISLAPPTLDSFIHPDCKDYTASDLEYAACVDGINGKTPAGGANSLLMKDSANLNKSPIYFFYNGTTISSTEMENWATHSGPYLAISGWAVVDGGVSKYVYSIDGGKTWLDCETYGRSIGNVPEGFLENAAKRIGYKDANNNLISGHPFTSDDDTTNGLFSGLNALNPRGIAANLSGHEGEVVHVLFAAVPSKDTSSLCLIAYIGAVEVVAQEEIVTAPIYNDYVKEGSGYSVSKLQFAACIDRIHSTGFGTNQINSSNSDVTKLAFNNTAIAAYGTENYTTTPGNYLVFSGWAVVRGGIEKYVWSADGGNTWQEVELYGAEGIPSATSDIMASQRVQNLGYTFTVEADGANSKFQAPVDKSQVKGLAANLADYAGQTVDVIFAAVPKIDTTTLCVIAVAQGVSIPK